MRESQFLLFLLYLLLFSSCNENGKETQQLKKPPINEQIPEEPCETVSWAKLAVVTHGYQDSKFDTVTIETYFKNSNFDSLVSTFKVLNNQNIHDEARQAKRFALPKEITSDVDMRIIFGKRDTFNITEIETDWLSRFTEAGIFYECTISRYLVNGKRSGGSIKIKNPDFKYPWE